MLTVAMVILAGSVAAGYFTIAGLVAPRIRMPTADDRVVRVIRGAAIAFFIGCGLTHVHVVVHTLGFGTPAPVEAHELGFHALQAVGAWLFIAGAILRFELHVVPAQSRAELEAAVAEQRQLARQAETLARRDELTGLDRRWRFDEELERQVAHARRYGVPGALLLIDVDGLKAVNDTCGHQTGDTVLRHVAQAMQSELRAGDLAARIGGDEFAVILPEARGEEAESAARRVVDALRGSASSRVPRTSVSVGVALIEGSLVPAEVMKLADVALYEAKRAGGDRYVLSDPTPEPQVP